MSSDGGGVGEGAHRDELGPGRGVGGHVLEGDAARHLDHALVAGGPQHGHAVGHLARRHVVEQHQVGADEGRHLGLAQRVALHLDGPARVEVAGLGHRLLDGDAEQVVVLEQDAVGQVAPVVEAAAGPHRRLLQRPQAGRGLAGVADVGAGVGGVGVAAGEGGDARQVAQEVEGGALGDEDAGQAAGDGGDGLAGDDPVAVVGPPVEVDVAVDLEERPRWRPAVRPARPPCGGRCRRWPWRRPAGATW